MPTSAGRGSVAGGLGAAAVAVALSGWGGLAATQGAPVPPAREPQPPVRITADAAEYFNQESLVVFTGAVVATQGETTLTAERMEVVFTRPESRPGDPAGGLGEAQAGRRITSITATQKVTMRQVNPGTGQERIATGERGVYDAGQRLVTLTGNPRLVEGRNVILGETMVFHLQDRKVLVRGKVDVTVYPENAQDPPPLPVRVTAETADYFDRENLVVFTGAVVAVQGDTTLTAERMEVAFAPLESRGDSAAQATQTSNRRLATILATRSVTFRQLDPKTGKERYATGERGFYDAGPRLMTMTGSPRLWEGKNIIVGEEMVFTLDDKKAIVKGQVNLTVYPEETRQETKP